MWRKVLTGDKFFDLILRLNINHSRECVLDLTGELSHVMFRPRGLRHQEEVSLCF